MGASSWIYYVPYQENIEQAFQELRQHIFTTDDYNHFWYLHVHDEHLEEIEKRAEAIQAEFPAPRTIEEAIKLAEKNVEGIPSLPPPQTIEEAVKMSQPEGTHSLLDISQLITDARYYGDVPVPEAILQHFFAETRPTRTVVEALVLHEEVWSSVDRWLHLYIQLVLQEKRNVFLLFGVSEQMLQFYAVERSKQELVEAFLQEEQMWSGLHELIKFNIEQIANRTRIGRAMPFSSADLLRWFGSEKPTRGDVEAACKQDEIWDSLRSDVGYYATLYQADAPTEIVFLGFSGR